MKFELIRWFVRTPPILRGLALFITIVILFGLSVIPAIGLDAFKDKVGGNPWIAGVCFAFVLLLTGIATGVFGNIAYKHYERLNAILPPRVEEFFQNHDLARLVGQSLGMILRSVAASLPKGADADKATVLKLALSAEEDWPSLSQGPRARLFLQEIRENRLVDFVRDPQRSALSEGQIGLLLKLLNEDSPPSFHDATNGEKVRSELALRFSEAVRQALKHDFAKRGEAAFGILLDILGEIMAKSAADMPQTPENAQAVNAARLTLRETTWLVDGYDYRVRAEALAQQLDQVYHAVRSEGQASARRDRRNHWGLAGLAVLGIAVLVGLWIEHIQTRAAEEKTRMTIEQNTKRQQEEFARITAKLEEYNAPKQNEDPRQKQLPPELLKQAELLKQRGDMKQQVVADIALGNHLEADHKIQELKKEPLAEAFELLTQEGNNWYNAGEFDKAVQPFEQALALQPHNPNAIENAATAHIFAELGDIPSHRKRAIQLLASKQEQMATGSLDWARTQTNMGAAYASLTNGDPDEHQSEAIEVLTQALQVTNKESNPTDWGIIQINLCKAWSEKTTGDRSENLSKAIRACELALEVFSPKTHPHEFALIKSNLAAVLISLPTGNREENFQQAKSALDAALSAVTQEADPVAWATSQTNLGNAWLIRLAGDHDDNLNKAIDAFRAALEVLTKEAHPVKWANVQNNLGVAFGNLHTGNIAENQKQAIDALRSALEIVKQDAQPELWAKIHLNLGNVFLQKTDGDRGENLKSALDALDAASMVYTQKAYPEMWAKVQMVRGLIFQTTPNGDRVQNFLKAKDAFHDALQVFTLQAYPYEGALVQSMLGNLWLYLPGGDIEQNQRNAIKAFKAALTILTQESYPLMWAATQYGLGNAWRGRAFLPWGGQDDLATNAYQEALKVYTRQSHPTDWAEMQMYLASRVTLDKSNKEKSCNSMQQVIMRIRAVEKLNLTTGWKDWWVKYIRSQWIEFLCGNDASFDAIPPLE